MFAALLAAALAAPLPRVGWLRVEVDDEIRGQREWHEHLVPTEPCPRPQGPVFVLVPGIGGDGPEWHRAVERLAAVEGAQAWLYRWLPYAPREPTLVLFVEGMARVWECAPDSTITVIAHSAGGILASLALPRLPRGMRLALYTVASPLAGASKEARPEEILDWRPFVATIGSARTTYAAAPEGFLVTHVRTDAQSDPHMRPDRTGHVPNDPAVRVPGATVTDAPAELGHDEALEWAVGRLVQ